MPTPDPLDDFSELDALLEEALSEDSSKKAAQTARARIAKGGPSQAALEEDRARIREWESRNEWRRVAVVAKFSCTDCKCGEYTGIFSGFLIKETHRHLRGTIRYLPHPTSFPLPDLPRITVQEVFHSPVCTACAGDSGWDMEHAETWGA